MEAICPRSPRPLLESGESEGTQNQGLRADLVSGQSPSEDEDQGS